MVDNYQKRISSPLMDRIDIRIEMPSVDYEKLAGKTLGETSASVRARVEAARERQLVSSESGWPQPMHE
jgi:magnesium chelatase family protein